MWTRGPDVYALGVILYELLHWDDAAGETALQGGGLA